jgi:serine/threonine protein kinase
LSPSDDDADDDRTIIRPPSQRAAAAPLGHMLPLGTHLLDYEITGLIGEGGFGIVYLAWDHSLQRKVAIKEYMPASMASRIAGSSAIVVKSERHLDTFKAGLKSFMNEARLLARFDHPALVKVYRFWEENGTAYMAMPFYEGPTLKTALADMGHAPSEAQLRAWLAPLLDALAAMHAAQCFHRDIAPDNILLTQTGPLLLDFGAARRVIGDMTHALTVVLKPGYAPIEQYGDVATMTQGAWTDIYALACVVYYAITGRTPMSSVERLMDDRLAPLALEAQGRYGEGFLRAIDAALAVRPQDRPQNEAQFRALLDIDQPASARPGHSGYGPLSGYGALSHEPFPATRDGGYSTVPGTLSPELATQVHARTEPPAAPEPPRLQPPAPEQHLQPPSGPPHPAPAPARRPPAVIATPPPPSPVLPEASPAARAPQPPAPAAPRTVADPGARSRTVVLGFASLLVVSGLALGAYWMLRPDENVAARPASTATAAVAPPEPTATSGPPTTSPAARTPATTATTTATTPAEPAASAPAAATPTLPPAATTTVEPPKPAPTRPAAAPREPPTSVAPMPRPAPARPREPPTESRPPPAATPAYPQAYPQSPRPPAGARCSDILQKASLEPLTAEEAAYLKRECR